MSSEPKSAKTLVAEKLVAFLEDVEKRVEQEKQAKLLKQSEGSA